MLLSIKKRLSYGYPQRGLKHGVQSARMEPICCGHSSLLLSLLLHESHACNESLVLTAENNCMQCHAGSIWESTWSVAQSHLTIVVSSARIMYTFCGNIPSLFHYSPSLPSHMCGCLVLHAVNIG